MISCISVAKIRRNLTVFLNIWCFLESIHKFTIWRHNRANAPSVLLSADACNLLLYTMFRITCRLKEGPCSRAVCSFLQTSYSQEVGRQHGWTPPTGKKRGSVLLSQYPIWSASLARMIVSSSQKAVASGCAYRKWPSLSAEYLY
jgi:hypothetical protein